MTPLFQKSSASSASIDRVLLIPPLVLATYPVLSFAMNNISLVSPWLSWRLVVAFSVFSILIYFFLLRVLKDALKASLIGSLLFICIHAYGWLYESLEGKQIGQFLIGRHLVLFPLWALIFVSFILIILKNQPQSRQFLSKILVVGSALLVAFLLLQMVLNYNWYIKTNPQSPSGQTGSPANYPDVYYIVLDGYSRYDVYKNLDFDNANFITSLEALGFIIPRCSQSNYVWTPLSLSSVFQMNYLEGFGNWQHQLQIGEIDYAYWGNYIRENPVRDLFKNMGYTIVSAETGYVFSEWQDADIFIAKNKDVLDRLLDTNNLKAFEYHYLRFTMLRVFLELEDAYLQPLVNVQLAPDEDHYQRVLFLLDQLGQIPAQISSPKFIYMHIVSPHEPYVFDREGNYAQKNDNSGLSYVNQTIYLNSRILPLMEKIIQSYSAEDAPIIILQSDHGFGLTKDRVKNLAAYYLPGVEADSLSPYMTPVNTFRFIFNEYFGTRYDLLEDKSYFNENTERINLELVPQSCFSLP